MNFTEKLDHLMNEHGLNRSSFAQECGIPYTTVCGWFDRGYEGVRLSTVRKIAETFNTGLEYWAYDELPETKNSPAPEDAEDDEISVEDMREFLSRLGFIAEGRDLSEKDIIFMRDVFDLLGVWFGQ